MSQTDDLNAAVTALTKGFAALDAAVSQQTAKLTEAMSHVQQPDPETAKAITDAITNIESMTGQMAQKAAELTADVPAATTVDAPDVTAPAGEPTVEAPALDMPPITAPDALPPDEGHDPTLPSTPSFPAT